MRDLATDLADWLETEFTLAGEAMHVLPWQREFIRGYLDEDESAISMARANGKTSLLAGISAATLHPGSPTHRPHSTIGIAASSVQQARIAFDTVLSALGETVEGRDWRVNRSVNNRSILYTPSSTELRVLSSDPARAHGLQASLLLADEPAQWPNADGNRLLFNALQTALGKLPDAKMVSLGTKAASNLKWWYQYIEEDSEYVFKIVHAASEDDDPFAEEAWKRANPSWDYFPALRKRIRKEADMAKRDPAMLRTFKALRLNMGTDEVETNYVISPTTWAECVEVDELPPREGGCIWGVDLGGNKAMSAIAAYWPESGRLEALGCFPGIPTLEERSREDGVAGLYEKYRAEGSVIVVGSDRRVPPVSDFLNVALSRFGEPEVVIGDPHRWAEVMDWASDRSLDCEVVNRQMANDFMAEDLRLFRESCMEGRVAAKRNRLFRASLGMARVRLDERGREVLAAKAEGGRSKQSRDDTVAAMIQAVSEGHRRLSGGSVWVV